MSKYFDDKEMELTRKKSEKKMRFFEAKKNRNDRNSKLNKHANRPATLSTKKATRANNNNAELIRKLISKKEKAIKNKLPESLVSIYIHFLHEEKDFDELYGKKVIINSAEFQSKNGAFQMDYEFIIPEEKSMLLNMDESLKEILNYDSILNTDEMPIEITLKYNDVVCFILFGAFADDGFGNCSQYEIHSFIEGTWEEELVEYAKQLPEMVKRQAESMLEQENKELIDNIKKNFGIT